MFLSKSWKKWKMNCAENILEQKSKVIIKREICMAHNTVFGTYFVFCV